MKLKKELMAVFAFWAAATGLSEVATMVVQADEQQWLARKQISEQRFLAEAERTALINAPNH